MLSFPFFLHFHSPFFSHITGTVHGLSSNRSCHYSCPLERGRPGMGPNPIGNVGNSEIGPGGARMRDP